MDPDMGDASASPLPVIGMRPTPGGVEGLNTEIQLWLTRMEDGKNKKDDVAAFSNPMSAADSSRSLRAAAKLKPAMTLIVIHNSLKETHWLVER